MKLLPLAIVTATLLLSACDAWPTIINNRSQQPISFQYHERSHKEWSARFSLNAGEAQRLAREHWVQNVTGLRIREGGNAYTIDYVGLEPVRRACESSLLSRRLKFTPDCYVTYRGGGKLSASFEPPARLVFHDFGNGS